jgi:hypothetical protein
MPTTATTNKALSAKRISHPKEFISDCRAAVVKAKGNVREAAKKLRVSRRTLTRYIEQFPEILEGARDE